MKKKEKSQSKILKLLLKKNKKEKTNIKWVLLITILAFTISMLFSFISEITLSKTNVIIGFIVLILFIFIGIIFDVIGVSVTTANEAPFHSMAARKVKGAKNSIFLKKNADKVSSICNDVVGDICGIISGSAGALITATIAEELNTNIFGVGLIITGFIASLTIGGKAISKSFAINNSDVILYEFAKFISLFKKEK